MPLSTRVSAALEAQQPRQRTNRLKAGPSWVVSEHVFATEAGTALEPRKVSRWFDNLAKKVGVGGSMHTLRHTALTSMVLAGVPTVVVSRIDGHESTPRRRQWRPSSLGHPSSPGRRDGGRRPA